MKINVVRAWKDAEYRSSLSAEELAMVPANPVGEIELRDEDLASVVGAGTPHCHRSHSHFFSHCFSVRSHQCW